jgi:hypothetical protein
MYINPFVVAGMTVSRRKPVGKMGRYRKEHRVDDRAAAR